MGVPLQASIYIAEINLHKINKGGEKNKQKDKTHPHCFIIHTYL